MPKAEYVGCLPKREEDIVWKCIKMICARCRRGDAVFFRSDHWRHRRYKCSHPYYETPAIAHAVENGTFCTAHYLYMYLCGQYQEHKEKNYIRCKGRNPRYRERMKTLRDYWFFKKPLKPGYARSIDTCSKCGGSSAHIYRKTKRVLSKWVCATPGCNQKKIVLAKVKVKRKARRHK